MGDGWNCDCARHNGSFLGTHIYVLNSLKEANNAPQSGQEASLTVFPYASPVIKEPFETDFVLENKSPFALKEVTCDFIIRKIKFKGGLLMANLRSGGGIYVKELRAGAQTTLHSSNAHLSPIGNNLAALDSAELEIEVKFSDARNTNKPHSISFLFFTKRQETGEMKWYPIAE